MTLTVEQLFAKINRAGWLVTDLIQRDTSDWVCSLRPKGDWSRARAEGSTVELVIAAAVEQMDALMTEKDWQRLKASSGKQKRYRMGGKVERVKMRHRR